MSNLRLNAWLDRLPRRWLSIDGRHQPTYGTLGVAGYYVAVVISFGTALAAARSLLVTAALCIACAASFFVWAQLRRRLTARETYVLLEHVWAAELFCAGLLWLLDEPILPYLDVVSVALCVFLAFGRAGCLVGGCCYGIPSSLGIRYPDAGPDVGPDAGPFPTWLAGVRLFPVQAVEAAGLLCIAATGFGLAIFASAGCAFFWFALAYSVFRFGLESLRADPRPTWLGLSQARWMAIVEVAVVLAWSENLAGGLRFDRRGILVWSLAAATLLVGLAARWIFDPRRPLLRERHLRELRVLVGELLDPAVRPFTVRATSAGVNVCASLERRTRGGAMQAVAHLSLSLPPDRRDTRALCELLSHALPSVETESAVLQPTGVLNAWVVVHKQGTPLPPTDPVEVGRALYRQVIRRSQTIAPSTVTLSRPAPAPHLAPVPAPPSPHVVPPAAPHVAPPAVPLPQRDAMASSIPWRRVKPEA